MTSKQLCLLSMLLVVCASTTASPRAEARPLYKKVWERVYLDKTDSKIDCGLCHPSSKKAELNRYGQALANELGEKNCRDEKQIEEAIRKIGKR